MAAHLSTPAQSDSVEYDHDDTMGDQSEEEEEDSKLADVEYGDVEYSEVNHHDADHHSVNHHDVHNEGLASASESTDYSLFTNPPDLTRIRQSLFSLEEGFEMSPTDFDAYFPFIDNIWRKARGSEQTSTDGSTELYWCRARKIPGIPHVPRPTPEGKTPRRKRVREDKSCGMHMKVTYVGKPVNKIVIAAAKDDGNQHTHDLEYMDSLKRNSAVMDVARREANRAFQPTSVFWKMWTEPAKMREAGGNFMKVSDVRNVQHAWRVENQTVPLKAHTGYNSQRAAQGPAVARPKPVKQSPNQTISNVQPQPVPIVQPRPNSLPAQTNPPPRQFPQYVPPPSRPPLLLPPDTLQYPEHARTFLQTYLPNVPAVNARQRPHITITWASSLDGRIALSPGHRTMLSGPETKAMTHYLRSQHDAILVGVRTAIADDPSLNCRLSGAGGYGGIGTFQQPRPVVLDPHARLLIRPEMNVLKVTAEGRAKAPWIIVAPHTNLHPVAVQTLKSHGGEFLMINGYDAATGGFGWEGIFNVLYKEGIRSIMIEGGGVILSELLKPKYAHLIDSVIMTISPTYLGKLGVQVSQDSCLDGRGALLPTRLRDLRWQPMGDNDVVMCGRPKVEDLQGLPVRQLQYVKEAAQVPLPPTQQPVQSAPSYPAYQAYQPPQPHQQQVNGNGNGSQPVSGPSILQGIEEFSNAAPRTEAQSTGPVAKKARIQ